MGKRQSEKTRRQKAEQKAEQEHPVQLSESPLLRVTLPFIGAFFVGALFPRIRTHANLAQSYYVATAILLIWLGLLAWKTVSSRRHLSFEFVPRRHHYMQAFVQFAIFVYWGWYWRTVYESAILIVSQLLFAYALDSLLCWTRRDKWVLGFGPFPIIFSTNIFLWFKDDWFYLQFVMIAMGFLAKEFIHWKRDGKDTHIFNPSAFALGVFSLILAVTNNSDLTNGLQIARTLFLPPHIYLFLFLLGLIAMFFFSTTLIAATTAITLFALSAIYFRITGVYWFIDSQIPVAVFLGLHLLVTDPATSPRTLSGKVIFGVIYGVLVFISYGILATFGIPNFYDKLLPIPIVNLCVRAIDKFVDSRPIFKVDTANWQLGLSPRSLNVALMSIWILFFVSMSAVGAVGDEHPGKYVPFWQNACNAQLRNSCATLVNIEGLLCDAGSGWSCNEVGIHYLEGKITAPNNVEASRRLTMACQAGFPAGCSNSLFALVASRGMAPPVQHADPEIQDYRIILRAGKPTLTTMAPAELMDRACQQGFKNACRQSASR